MTDNVLMPGYISTSEAAKRLGVSGARIRQLVASGVLESQKLTDHWVFVTEKSVEAYATNRPKAARPRKKEAGL